MSTKCAYMRPLGIHAALGRHPHCTRRRAAGHRQRRGRSSGRAPGDRRAAYRHARALARDRPVSAPWSRLRAHRRGRRSVSRGGHDPHAVHGARRSPSGSALRGRGRAGDHLELDTGPARAPRPAQLSRGAPRHHDPLRGQRPAVSARVRRGPRGRSRWGPAGAARQRGPGGRRPRRRALRAPLTHARSRCASGLHRRSARGDGAVARRAAPGSRDLAASEPRVRRLRGDRRGLGRGLLPRGSGSQRVDPAGLPGREQDLARVARDPRRSTSQRQGPGRRSSTSRPCSSERARTQPATYSQPASQISSTRSSAAWMQPRRAPGSGSARQASK